MNELSLTARDIRANVNLIQEVMKEVMIGPTKEKPEGVHYGIIPGTKKPTLLKPGSEKILATFRLAVEPLVEDLSTADCARYRVIARVTHIGTGQFVGSGIGECSSDEEKYRWRKSVCDQEFDEAPIDRRREKWFQPYQKPAYKVKQVRTNIADVANTILKMAKKRAQIDATLTATAASDVFDQDIEDLPEELRPQAESRPDIAPPQEKKSEPVAAEPKPQIQAIDIVGLLQKKSGERANVFGYIQSGEQKQFPKRDKTGMVDITVFSVSDTAESPANTVQIKVWGKQEIPELKKPAVFENVVISTYKDSLEYVAGGLLKDG